jgi:hypothetical protein
LAPPWAGAAQQLPSFPDWLSANSDAVPYRDKPSASSADIDLSADAAAIRVYLLQPLHQRAAAFYRQEFLDAYVPNLSCYLPTALRAELHICGQAVQSDAQASPPAGTFARRIAHRLLPDLSAAGRLRTIAVGITQTTFQPLDMPQRIEACFRQVVEKAAAIHDPFEQAFFLLVHLPYLQPFEDVNKRVSRLAANIPLIRNNLCPLSFVETELLNLHEGSIARFRLRPAEFQAWRLTWH